MKITEYTTDDGTFSEFQTFNIPNEGFHKITFKSTDNVNNQERTKESYVYVDNKPPKIYVNFSIASIGKKQKNGKPYKVYPTYVKLYLAATDSKSGAEKIFYSVNGTALKEYTYNRNFSYAEILTKEQFYSIKVVAEDKLGNQGEETIEFFVED